MNTELFEHPHRPAAAAFESANPPQSGDAAERQRAVDCILADCFFTVGQVVGMRTTVDYDAVIWWRDHYRARFQAAIHSFGDRWLQDRQNVTAVAFLLGERAVRYAAHDASIGVASAQKAAADVERYCQLHSRRAAAGKLAGADAAPARIAGYWCIL